MGWRTLVLACAGALLALISCETEGAGDGSGGAVDSGVAAAIPDRETVQVDFPGATGSDGALTAALTGENAKLYLETVHTVRALNAWTWALLQLVEEITSNPPTSVTREGHVWGPFTPALSLATFRFVVTQTGERTYDYRLESRGKAEQTDGDFVAILAGSAVVAATGERDGNGSMTLDFDAAVSKDQTVRERGQLRVDYSRTGGVRSNEMTFTNFVGEDDDPGRPVNATYAYHEQADRSGDFSFEAELDLHEVLSPPQSHPAKETWTINTAWVADGTGRAKAVVAGGDLDQGNPPVDRWEADECWGPVFDRTYYQERITFVGGAAYAGDAEGDVGQCP